MDVASATTVAIVHAITANKEESLVTPFIHVLKGVLKLNTNFDEEIKRHLDLASGTEVCILCRLEHRRKAGVLAKIRDGEKLEEEDEIKPKFRDCNTCKRRA
jgi:hypothetical protein